MPGLLATTLQEGYGYLDPYLEKTRPYMEKARNAVPLTMSFIDQAAQKVEEIVPPLIQRADKIAEPNIDKIRPYVEPRIEQMRPYVDKGVEKYGVLCEESAKYYHTKANQINEFKEAKATQIREFAEPKVEKIKGAVEPKFAKVNAAVEAKKQAGLEKVACGVDKVEEYLDYYVPLTEDQKRDRFRPAIPTSKNDTQYDKIKRKVHVIGSRLLAAFMVKTAVLLSLPMQLKAAYMDGTLKKNFVTHVMGAKCWLSSKVKYSVSLPQKLFASMAKQASEKLAPPVKKLAQTPAFKKAVKIVITSSEQTFGEEKTTIILRKVESFIPEVWKNPKEGLKPIAKKL